MKYSQRVKRGQFSACGVWNSKFCSGSSFYHFPVTPKGKSKISDGNGTRAARTWGYIWPVMDGDWAGAKDGGLGNERLVSRYISLSSLHHQSSFSFLFRGPSVFSFICLSLSLFLVFWCHSIAGYFLSCSKTKHRTWWDSTWSRH